MKTTISVAIPAYNEGMNIKSLLQTLLVQEQSRYFLKEIIVISDGSTDDTVEQSESLKSQIITVIQHADRQGLASRQNEIIERFTGDILILLNADVLLTNPQFIAKIIKPIQMDARVGIVSNEGVPLPARNFFEAVINFSVDMRQKMTATWKGGDNIFLCHGHARAFSRAFAKQIQWTYSIGEDAYSYLLLKRLGYGFIYEPDVIVHYRSPQNLKDHLKQSIRFKQSHRLIENSFPEFNVADEYRIPKSIFFKYFTQYFFKNPLYILCYCIIQMFAFFNPYRIKISQAWEPSQSSKLLKD